MRILTDFDAHVEGGTARELVSVSTEWELQFASMIMTDPSRERVGRCIDKAIEAFKSEWGKG